MADEHDREEAFDNRTSFPIVDTGLGEHVATLRIVREELDKRSMAEALKIVSQAVVPAPVQFVFGASLPPPIFVTVSEAAEVMSTDRDDIVGLCRNGWLNPVQYRGGVLVDGVAIRPLDSPRYGSFDARILWAELISLAGWMVEHNHLPLYPNPNRRHPPVEPRKQRDRGFRGKLEDVEKLVDSQTDP